MKKVIVYSLSSLLLLSSCATILTGSLRRVKTKYIKVDMDAQSLAVQGYLEKGRISKVVIDEKTQVIETTIVLD